MRRRHLLLLLVAPWLMAPPLGDCGSCPTIVIPVTAPAWTVAAGDRFDAGFTMGRAERAVHVTVTVSQPPDASENREVNFKLTSYFPQLVTANCTNTSPNLCFDHSTGRPTGSTPPQPKNDQSPDYGTCPVLGIDVDGGYFNDFATVSLIDEAGNALPTTRQCTGNPGCTIDKKDYCQTSSRKLTRSSEGPDFHCDRDAGRCTTSFDVSVQLNDPTGLKQSWRHDPDGGAWILAPLTEAERLATIIIEATVEGPVLRSDCKCEWPAAPPGLSVALELTPIR